MNGLHKLLKNESFELKTSIPSFEKSSAVIKSKSSGFTIGFSISIFSHNVESNLLP